MSKHRCHGYPAGECPCTHVNCFVADLPDRTVQPDAPPPNGFSTKPDPSEPHPDWCRNPAAHHHWEDCYRTPRQQPEGRCFFHLNGEDGGPVCYCGRGRPPHWTTCGGVVCRTTGKTAHEAEREYRARAVEPPLPVDPEPAPLHGHNYGGDWIECTDEHASTPLPKNDSYYVDGRMTTQRKPTLGNPTLDAFAAWMKAGDHDPIIREEYGDQVIECQAKGCLAGSYDWLSTHIHDFTRDTLDADEPPDFGQCCGNVLDSGECCAAANGTANLR